MIVQLAGGAAEVEVGWWESALREWLRCRADRPRTECPAEHHRAERRCGKLVGAGLCGDEQRPGRTGGRRAQAAEDLSHEQRCTAGCMRPRIGARATTVRSEEARHSGRAIAFTFPIGDLGVPRCGDDRECVAHDRPRARAAPMPRGMERMSRRLVAAVRSGRCPTAGTCCR